jgi:hypothetical protein
MIWNADLFAYTLGSVVCCESLKTGGQTLLYAHSDDITALALSNDLTHIASVSASTSVSTSPSCQIIIWICARLERVANVFHENVASVRLMSFSPDDRFLLTVSEWSSVAVWRVSDYTRLLVSDCFRDSGLLDFD